MMKSILFSLSWREAILGASEARMDGLAALITLVAFATSVISAVFGMAGGMILMGVYAIALPVQVAMILHGITQLFANGFRAFLCERIYTAGLGWYALEPASAGCFTWPHSSPPAGAVPLLGAIPPASFASALRTPLREARCRYSRRSSRYPLAGVSGPAARRLLRVRTWTDSR
jgi:hypothetical protein